MAEHYHKLDSGLVAVLKMMVGDKNVLTTAEQRERYSCDEMPVRKPRLPEVVVTPTNVETVTEIMRFASAHKIPVTPRGSGTGLSGGCVPLHGGIVLSLEKMNHILEIDEANQVAVVEPGVTLGNLQEAAQSRNLYYPVYPGEKSATLGGNIATNAGGMRAVKYGVTRHFVLGVEAVLASGKILRLGGKYVKCTTGYDLAQLLIGSEGTLAVITQATLRLGVPPGAREILFIPFPNLERGIEAVPAILSGGNIPVGLEFMERDIIQIAEQYLEREIPFHQYEAFLLVILEGGNEAEVLEACHRIGEAVRAYGAIDVFVPPTENARRDLLDAREKFFTAIKRLGPLEIADVVVPRSLIAEFVKRVKGLAKKYGIDVIAYGHAGDGNVHLHPLGRGMKVEDWERKLPELMNYIYRAGLDLGGAISGEHGIGFEKRRYFETILDKDLLEVMKSVKHALDPDNILNPGKLFSH